MLGSEDDNELSVEQQLELALKVMTKDQIENWKLEQALSAMEAKLNSMGVHNKILNERIKEFVAKEQKRWTVEKWLKFQWMKFPWRNS